MRSRLDAPRVSKEGVSKELHWSPARMGTPHSHCLVPISSYLIQTLTSHIKCWLFHQTSVFQCPEKLRQTVGGIFTLDNGTTNIQKDSDNTTVPIFLSPYFPGVHGAGLSISRATMAQPISTNWLILVCTSSDPCPEKASFTMNPWVYLPTTQHYHEYQ